LKITGIICEYNPLHLGHKKQLDTILRLRGSDSATVCIMSGNYVQRGAPAIFDKGLRARAAVLSGADLVLELPVTAALSSAEGFAAGGVALLAPLCDTLCFGAETADRERLLAAAHALLSEQFSDYLARELEKGLSFPAARQAAMAAMGCDAQVLRNPNDILAVEYCKAILSQNVHMDILPIHRPGSYHDTAPDTEDPSATAVRALVEARVPWLPYIPAPAQACFEKACVHTLRHGERFILGKLRTMTDEQFASLPYGSEGLWRKLMHACRAENTLDNILSATKSKRYTRSRLDRMVMCAALGITAEDVATPAPYARVLAFNDRGREVLRTVKDTGLYPNIGHATHHPFETLEQRCSDLYGLFAESPEPPGADARMRVFYHRQG